MTAGQVILQGEDETRVITYQYNASSHLRHLIDLVMKETGKKLKATTLTHRRYMID